MSNFNPADFGFDMSFSKHASAGSKLGNYLSMSDKNTLKLVIDKATSDLVRDICGERVAFGFDEKGRVLLTKAIDCAGRKLSGASNTNGSLKCTVSMNSMFNAYQRIQGTFRRSYMDAEPYCGGKAVVFTPTGRYDRV